MQHNNFKNLLSQAYNQKNDCDTPVLLKYTKTISCNLDKIIYNLCHNFIMTMSNIQSIPYRLHMQVDNAIKVDYLIA